MKPKISAVIGLAVILLCIAFYFIYQSSKQANITSFDECVKDGNPVLESYPAQCKTKDGKHFTQDIGNELEKQDKIKSTNPRPNQTISSPLKITGEARGYWYFEGVFPVVLVDSKGNVIARGSAKALGEWMSDKFVPYETTLEFKTEDSKGRLILERDNPSGIPENAEELDIPVVFN